MADSEGKGGNSFLAFLVGGLLVAVIVIGVFVYTGGLPQQQPETLEVNMPDVKINPPDIDVPEPNLPEITPTPAPEPAPAQ